MTLAAVTVLFLPLALLAAPAPAGAAIVPPNNPGANITPAPGYSGPCGSLANPNLYCPSGLTLLYGDRQAEGLAPMSLPSNWTSLTPPEQLFVLTDEERIDRGLVPISGLAANLNAYAQAGANAHTDPPFPRYGSTAGATVASTASLGTALALWMYDDGPGGTNVGCPASGGGGCWGHRDIILGSYAAPSLMGVGYGPSTTQLFVGGDTVDTPYFTWAQEAPLLPVGVYPFGVNASVLPGTSQNASMELWASGENMNITATQSGGQGVFTMGTTSCNLAPGQSCNVPVHFAPPGVGVYTATVSVSGPNGTQNVLAAGRGEPRLSPRGLRRWRLLLRRRPLRRLDRRAPPQPARGGHDACAQRHRVLDGGRRTAASSTTAAPASTAPWAASGSTPRSWAWRRRRTAAGTGRSHPTGASSASATPTSTAPGAANPSTGPSWAWRRTPRATGTGSSPPTGGSSASATPASTARPATSRSVRPVVGMAADGQRGRVLAGGVRRWGVHLRQRQLPGLHRRHGARPRPWWASPPPPTAAGTGSSASDGGIFNYGDAGFFGSMGGQPMVAPIVGGAA